MFWKLSTKASLGIDCRTAVTRCRHVCKTCAFHDVVQAGKKKEVHSNPLFWRPQASDQGSTVYFFLFPRLKSNMKGARSADVAATCDSGSAIDS
jgi:hypothetical protein